MLTWTEQQWTVCTEDFMTGNSELCFQGPAIVYAGSLLPYALTLNGTELSITVFCIVFLQVKIPAVQLSR